MLAFELKFPPVVQVIVAANLMWVLALALPSLSFRFPVQTPVAVVLSAVGITIAVLGVIRFRLAGTTVDPRVPDQSASLVAGGVYRLSRNPMYLGFFLVLSAWALGLGNVASFLILPLFVVCMNRLQIAPEERQLHKLFGEAYCEYTSNVRRWI